LLSRIGQNLGDLPFSLYLLFSDKSRSKNSRSFIEYIKEYWVQVSNLDSLHVQSYTCWRLRFVINLETNPKHVFKINLRSDVGVYMWTHVDLGFLCGSSLMVMMYQ